MWRKRLKNQTIFYVVRIFLAFINAIPRTTALSVCDTLGRIVCLCATGTRLRAIVNLNRGYGSERTAAEIRSMAVQVFRDLGRNAVDAVRMSQITPETVGRLVAVEGMEHLEAAYAEGKGVLAVSGHMGNFELLGAYLAMKGFRVTVVAAALYDERLDALLGANRIRGGLNVVQRAHATSAVLRALRRGEVVGLLVDQDTRVPGTFVRFFDHPTHTPVGPAVIAGRTGVPIVPMGIRRREDDTHLITIKPPISVEDRPSEEVVNQAVQKYTSEIESLIRQSPTQWVWMHDRWKTKPPAS
ncbi:MAG: lysophospholipid acyltransferase family protein [Gemmatimonadota bacterium]|nr:lysophospholipid acyltransferase family protein [Gemmatimonadota bacterium]